MKFLFPLLLVTQAWGQAFTPQDLPWLAQGATAPGLPLSLNPYEWWNFTNAATFGVSVTNWIGSIQGLVFTNAATANSPVNTANGVWFNATGQSLSNHPAQFNSFTLGTNWTVFIWFVYTNLDPGGAFGINAPLYADRYHNPVMGSSFQTTPKAQPEYVDSTGAQRTLGSVSAYWLKFTDWTFAMSNNVNGGAGASFSWTNGTFSQVGVNDRGWTNINNLGWDAQYNDGSTYLVGSIRHLLFFTNVLSAVQVSNLHYWRTNFDGTSP